MQLTHRYNYDRAGRELGQNFVANPDLVANEQWAFATAGLYWQWRSLNIEADAGDLVGATKKINGGTNGLDDRRRKYDDAKRCIGTSPSPSPVPSGSGCPRTYTVRSGDSLSAIASRFGTTVQAIAQLNGITNVNLIRVGQVLRIPC
jgi:nucleoid-associated protein YgaU